jgi:hypothetical protein
VSFLSGRSVLPLPTVASPAVRLEHPQPARHLLAATVPFRPALLAVPTVVPIVVLAQLLATLVVPASPTAALSLLATNPTMTIARDSLSAEFLMLRAHPSADDLRLFVKALLLRLPSLTLPGAISIELRA